MKALLTALLLITCVCRITAADAMSETMAQIVKHHLRGEHDFVMKGLPLEKNFKEPAKDDNYETYQLPAPPRTADYFNYRVILKKNTRQYWIIRSGGFAGRTMVYGPGDAAALK